MDYGRIAQEKLDSDDFHGAIEILNEAIEKNPRKSEYYYLRGEAKHGLEDYEDAIIDYDTAIELSKKYSHYYHMRGRSKYLLKRYKEAEADVTKAISIDGLDYTSCHILLPSIHRSIFL